MESRPSDSLDAFGVLSNKSVPHIVEKIFFSLDYKSFKSCMKVNKSHDVLVYQRGKESTTTLLSCTATEYSKKIEIFCFAKIYDEFRVSGF